MQGESLVLLDKDAQGIATLTLNRPEKFNAFTKDMIVRWADLLAACGDDPEVKVIVLTGAGKGFCSGGDIGVQKERLKNDAIERKDFLFRYVHRIARLMQQIDKPVIAAINGAARGAGMDMALMCDLRVMSETATLAETYINVGLIAGDGGTWYLPRLIGIPRALELFWSGRTVGAAEAERMGIVNRVVAHDDLMPATYELARSIASQPFEAVRAYKRAVYQGATMDLAAHLDLVSSQTSILRDTPDHRARVDAFLQRKRGS
jgi:enoyl-CoA hydratase/carnithine racemase